MNPVEPGAAAPSHLVEHSFRHEYGRLVASLTRHFGPQHLPLVEDAVQSALLTAVSAWRKNGPPPEPGAWLYTVARNRALDALRGAKTQSQLLDERAQSQTSASEPADVRLSSEVADDMLRMLFLSCSEELPVDSRLVFALKTLCGFSTQEIALRLFISEANVHKRLERALERLRERTADLELPGPDSLAQRLDSVHGVLYLLFNEGYQSAVVDRVLRRELCDEALRLTTLLTEHPVGATPSSFALLALMHLHAARLDARCDADGGLLLLEEQDRSRWDRAMIARGLSLLGRAATEHVFSRFHAEAMIAAEHCVAPDFASTRWSEIAELYGMLERLAPSPLHTMNRAVALAYAQSPQAGLSLLQSIEPPTWLSGFYLWDSVAGELHARCGDANQARRHWERAHDAAPTDAEKALLKRKLARL